MFEWKGNPYGAHLGSVGGKKGQETKKKKLYCGSQGTQRLNWEPKFEPVLFYQPAKGWRGIAQIQAETPNSSHLILEKELCSFFSLSFPACPQLSLVCSHWSGLHISSAKVTNSTQCLLQSLENQVLKTLLLTKCHFFFVCVCEK